MNRSSLSSILKFFSVAKLHQDYWLWYHNSQQIDFEMEFPRLDIDPLFPSQFVADQIYPERPFLFIIPINFLIPFGILSIEIKTKQYTFAFRHSFDSNNLINTNKREDTWVIVIKMKLKSMDTLTGVVFFSRTERVNSSYCNQTFFLI